MFCSLWFYKRSKANLHVCMKCSALSGGEHYTFLVSFVTVIEVLAQSADLQAAAALELQRPAEVCLY